MGKRLTQKEFINKCNDVHNYKYDYSLVSYNGILSNIDIICSKHGIFTQKAFIHKNGSGCQKCQNELNKKRNRVKSSVFINKAKIKHKDYYIYDKVKYTNAYVKVTIICPIHGEFIQVPHDHLKGSGCKDCGNYRKSKNKTLSTIDFINKSIEVHNNKYNYSKSIYCGSFKDVIIICKKHGEFLQKAAYHISGSGCSSCADESKSHNTEIFISKALNIHGNKYNYNKTLYKNIMTKVIITCHIHGDFKQRAQDHLKGSGCKFCKGPVSKLENKYFESLSDPNIIRNKSLFIGNKRYVPDGYNPITNTVYEVNGDYWHGNPLKFNENDINPSNGKTFGFLYKKTLKKQEMYKEAGFNVISVWESDI